jgi:hypothetical protein
MKQVLGSIETSGIPYPKMECHDTRSSEIRLWEREISRDSCREQLVSDSHHLTKIFDFLQLAPLCHEEGGGMFFRIIGSSTIRVQRALVTMKILSGIHQMFARFRITLTVLGAINGSALRHFCAVDSVQWRCAGD